MELRMAFSQTLLYFSLLVSLTEGPMMISNCLCSQRLASTPAPLLAQGDLELLILPPSSTSKVMGPQHDAWLSHFK